MPPVTSSGPSLVKADIVTASFPEDERLWVPLAEGVEVRPLMFDTSEGSWVNLLRVVPGGGLAMHQHAGPVHAYVVDGSWWYLEHDWVAHAGDYIYEPPGDRHTLVAHETLGMTTWFHTTGALVYTDGTDTVTGYDTVHTRIELTRAHYEKVGVDLAVVDAMTR
jgi:hypothetical protein